MLFDIDELGNRKQYHIETKVYNGPLDLLLSLIEKSELDITKLALAEVTDQYLEYLNSIRDKYADEVSEFIVVAAKLMQIKSEALLPRPPQREAGEEDPGEELIQQLLIYREFKTISKMLEGRLDEGYHSYLRTAPPPKIEGKLDLSGIDINHIYEMAIHLYKLADDRKPVDEVIELSHVTIKEKIKMIHSILIKNSSIKFSELFENHFTKLDVVVTFLAMLELMKQYYLQVNQDELFGEISIEKSNGEDIKDDFELSIID
jgi:segregation and condensation protein A